MAIRDDSPSSLSDLLGSADYFRMSEYDRSSRDLFGQSYPNFGADYERFIRRDNFEALESGVIGVMTSRFGIPEDMIRVSVFESRLLVISYNRGDVSFITEVEISGIHDPYYNGVFSLRVSDAISELIQKILSTPAKKKEKLEQIKFNLKDFKSWLESEAEDKEFVDVFMEYFGEEIDEEK